MNRSMFGIRMYPSSMYSTRTLKNILQRREVLGRNANGENHASSKGPNCLILFF
jgi:hypothetical protein